MVTIDEIARRAGVSKSTVSNVLNSRDERVSPETKSKVMQVIDELGYRSRRTKKGFSYPKTSSVVLLFPHSMSRFLNVSLYRELLNGISNACQRLNYQLITITSGQDFHPTMIYEDFLNQELGDGFIIVDLLKRDSRLKRFARGIKPFVALGKPEVQDTRGVSWVFIDVTAMVEKAVKRLITAGHRQVAFLGMEEKRIITLQAIRGYERALEKNRVSPKDKVVLYLEPDVYRAEVAVKELLKGNTKITALFTASQVIAEGAIKAARELGKKIPQDLAIMSMLENASSAQLTPALSGVDWKATDMGDHAVQLLVKIMEGKEEAASGRVISTDLIIRDSCGTKKE
ncbi:MAG: LacI family DNA-binding transcriptional regulator [Candidatus Atribacteria bacterium]|nr:LacI family DNA-binding transcriptional regulator [Candidatus Atribacteria bacterium]